MGDEAGRRELLLALTALGVVAVGCAGTPPAAPSPTAAPDDGFATGALPAAPGTGSGGAGTALGPATAVPVGGGAVFATLEVVVTQPTPGWYQGFSAVCTHTGCIVNRVADGVIECPCHGSRYRLDGSVAQGPATRSLTVREVRLEGGQLVLE